MFEAMVEKRLVFAVYSDPIKRDYLVNSPFFKFIEVCSSPKEVARRVKYYIENPKEEKQKIEKAYSWAIKQSWEKVIKTYKTIWNI
jgi:spore maturation protein CgeB